MFKTTNHKDSININIKNNVNNDGDDKEIIADHDIINNNATVTSSKQIIVNTSTTITSNNENDNCINKITINTGINNNINNPSSPTTTTTIATPLSATTTLNIISSSLSLSSSLSSSSTTTKSFPLPPQPPMLQSPPLSPLTTNTFHLKTNSIQENFLLDPFLYVNGRRYHNVPTASYFLPNDKQEIERLTLEHIIYHFIWNGNFSSPVDNVLKSSPAKNDKAKVLDIGCGPGHWLLEMAEEYPNANFVGIDISPVFPNEYDSNKPTNVAFLKFDALSENGLPFPNDTFDFVYQKFMVFFIPENKRMKHIEELIRVTKPGGWIELMDVDPLPYDTGPISTFFLQSMSTLLLSKGINRKMLFEIPILFNQKSELITVHSQERPNPIGSWGGKVGEYMLKNIELIVDPLKPYILPVLNLSEQEFHEMFKSIHDELNKNKTFCKSYRHFAQKQY